MYKKLLLFSLCLFRPLFGMDKAGKEKSAPLVVRNKVTSRLAQLKQQAREREVQGAVQGVVKEMLSTAKDKAFDIKSKRLECATIALKKLKEFKELQDEQDKRVDFDVLSAVSDLDKRIAEIRVLMQRLNPNFANSFEELLQANIDGIRKFVEIRPKEIYEFLNLPSDFAINLPSEVMLELIKYKVIELKTSGIKAQDADMVGRQLEYLFKNRLVKENYDSYIQNSLDKFIGSESIEELKAELDKVIGYKNEFIKNSSGLVFGNLNAELIEFLKKKTLIEDLFKKCANTLSFCDIDKRTEFVESVLRGAVINNEILNFDIDLMSSENKVSQVRDLINYYFALAIAKGQSFHEGSFIISNSQAQKLFSFLVSIPEASQRPSSHFKELGLKQYGLDVTSLLQDKGHLLFALIDDGSLFIKPENFGISGVYNFVMHGGELVVAQARKPWAQKLIPLLGHIFGTDQQAGFRKERIPEDILKKYQTLLETLSIEDSQTHIVNAQKYGIQSIYNKLCELCDLKASQINIEIIQEFKRSLEEKYDNLTCRFGEEVILTQDEFDIFTPEIIAKIKEGLSMVRPLSQVVFNMASPK